MKIEFKQTENEIDFDKQQLLTSINSEIIVLTNGEHSVNRFEGISIDRNPEFSKDWDKSFFKIFNGTISND